MRSIQIRDFLRGEYKNIKEVTVVTKHGRPVGTWVPFGSDWKAKILGSEGKSSSR
jgi:hypothetical protein